MAQDSWRVGFIWMLGRPDDPQVLTPRPDSLRVLPTHDSSNLNQVIQIVNHPRGEVLAERHPAELGVLAGTVQIGSSQVQRGEVPETPRT